MAYRLKKGKVNQKAVRRLVREQFSRTPAFIETEPLAPEFVHECRKGIKRVRTLLKLIEPCIPKSEFKRRYRAAGEINALLAHARDRHVLMATIEKLRVRFGGEQEEILSVLAARFEGSGHDYLFEPGKAATLAVMIRAEYDRYADLNIRSSGFAMLAPGLEATYRLVRDRLRAASRKSAGDETFHDLRKAVQWHWRQLSLISHVWPEQIEPHLAACRELAEILGDDHDLAMFKGEVKRLDALGEADCERLVAMAELRQRELRAVAKPMSARIFAERPKALVERMRGYWRYALPSVTARNEQPTEQFGELRSKSGKTAVNGHGTVEPSTAPRLAVKSPSRPPSRAAE